MILLDEPESGVDLENIHLVGNAIRQLQLTTELGDRSVLVITHTGHILKYLPTSIAHVMFEGKVHAQGNTDEIFETISNEGYSECIKKIITGQPLASPVIFTPALQDNLTCNSCIYSEDSCCPGERAEKELPYQCTGNVTTCQLGDQCTCKDSGFCKCLKAGLPQGSCRPDILKPTKCSGGSCGSCNSQSNCSSKRITVKSEGNKILLDNNAVDTGIELDEDADLMNLNDQVSENHGEYVQTDNSLGCYTQSQTKGIEVLNLNDAIIKYPEIVEKYLWKVMDPNKDDVTKAVAMAEKKQYNGYVIIAHEGAVTEIPVKSSLIMNSCENQIVHNLIIAKKDAVLHVSSFCKNCGECGPTENNTHFGISEFFVEENAHISFSMVHNYNTRYAIFPRSASRVLKNGVFISSYVCLQAVKKVQMAPTAYLDGENAVARFCSVLVSSSDETELDVGSTAFLNAKGCRTEMVARALTKNGKIINRGRIVSYVPETFGHIECQGMVLGSGVIRSIPEIEAGPEAELSHEASVGKIDPEKIDYLMARGITEEDAIAIIVRGFLDVTIKGIPESLQEEIRYVMEQASHGL